MNDSLSTEHTGRASANRLRLWFVLGLLGVAAVLATVWMTTPLRSLASVDTLSYWAEEFKRWPATPLIVLAFYVVGGLVLLPVSLTIAATGLVFGAWPGLAYAAIGTLASALATYAVGAGIGHERLTRLGGARIAALSRKAASKGLRSVIAIRIVPIAPFAVINAILGASHVRLRDYMLGTCLGMAPGILIKVLFADQLAEAAMASDEHTLWTLAAAAIAIVAIGVLIRKRYTATHPGVAPD